MAYGTPASPGRRRGVLHPHPPGPAARRPSSSPTSCAATTPSAASRRWPSAPRRSGPRSQRRPRRAGARPLSRSCSARSTPRRSSRTRSPTLADAGVDAHRRPGARPALLRRLASASTRTGSPRRPTPRGVARAPRSTAGTSSPTYLDFLAARRARRAGAACPSAPRCCSPPTRLPERVLVDDPYPDQLRESAAAVAERGRARPVGRLGARAGRAPGARPSRGAAPTSST